MVACSDDAAEESGSLPTVPEGGLCTSCGACEEQLSIAGAAHVEGDLRYPDPPPASGDHNPCWAKWGAHEEPVADENWVHNLEHGGVVFLYRCDSGCDEQVKMLAQFVEGHERALLTEYEDLPTKYAVVAWGVRLLSNCFDRGVFEDFYALHVGRGPESVTAGPPDHCH